MRIANLFPIQLGGNIQYIFELVYPSNFGDWSETRHFVVIGFTKLSDTVTALFRLHPEIEEISRVKRNGAWHSIKID